LSGPLSFCYFGELEWIFLDTRRSVVFHVLIFRSVFPSLQPVPLFFSLHVFMKAPFPQNFPRFPSLDLFFVRVNLGVHTAVISGLFFWNAAGPWTMWFPCDNGTVIRMKHAFVFFFTCDAQGLVFPCSSASIMAKLLRIFFFFFFFPHPRPASFPVRIRYLWDFT